MKRLTVVLCLIFSSVVSIALAQEKGEKVKFPISAISKDRLKNWEARGRVWGSRPQAAHQ